MSGSRLAAFCLLVLLSVGPVLAVQGAVELDKKPSVDIDSYAREDAGGTSNLAVFVLTLLVVLLVLRFQKKMPSRLSWQKIPEVVIWDLTWSALAILWAFKLGGLTSIDSISISRVDQFIMLPILISATVIHELGISEFTSNFSFRVLASTPLIFVSAGYLIDRLLSRLWEGLKRLIRPSCI